MVDETVSSFFLILMMEFAVMGLIILFLSFDPIGLSNLIRGINVDSHRYQKKYNGFESDWYFDQGGRLGIYIFLSFLFSNIMDISICIKVLFMRLRDRKWSMELKKDPDNPDDDQPNTKIKS